jgi:hypothetical protein
MARVVELLWNDTPLTADGYEVISGAPMPEPNQFRFTDEELRGIKVQESVLETDYVLEATA